jgi:TPR repeat protein
LIQNKAIKFYEEQFDILRKKKGLNSTGDQLQLGFLYQHGYGTRRSIQKAIECFVAAANEGFSEAQYHLGEIYLKDRSMKFKYEQAFQCFSISAESGNINAQCNLAYLYEKGIGIERDHSMALHWYTKAGNMRHHTA